MDRPQLSVVILASGEAAFTASLDALRAQLSARDEVIVVAAESDRARRDVVRRHRWVKRVVPVVAHEDAGPPRLEQLCAAGAAAASTDLIFFIDGDVILGPHALSSTAEAFADHAVVAAGPRCHWSAGPQSTVLPPADVRSVGTFAAAARRWRQSHERAQLKVASLGPVVFAVRRSAWNAAIASTRDSAGGATGIDPWTALAGYGRVVVTDHALAVHMGGADCALRQPAPAGRDTPLLSACMIVKDESEVLATCLESLSGLVDEIVVYDTGSVDDTIDIARAHGARVIEGFWNDSFGDARNRALEHVRGRWTLIIDADEEVVGDQGVIRAALRTHESDPHGAQGLRIQVECLDGIGATAPVVVPINRVFRTRTARYAGRLHEQVVDAFNGIEVSAEPFEPLRLVHSGYLAHRIVERNKFDRNVRLAHLEAGEAAAVAPELTLLNQARSEVAAGKLVEGAGTCRQILQMDLDPRLRRVVIRTLLAAEFDQGAGTATLAALIDDLRENSADSFHADEFEARMRLRDGDFTAALALISAHDSVVERVSTVDGASTRGGHHRAVDSGGIDVDTSLDEDGNEVQPLVLREMAIRALYGQNKSATAVDLTLDTIRRGVMPLSAGECVLLMRSSYRPLSEFAAAVPDALWKAVAVQAMQCRPAEGDAVLEALWNRRPGDRVTAVASAEIAPHLVVSRALEWSSRLRAAGGEQECPLIKIATDASRSAESRTMAAAIAIEMFTDERARELVYRCFAEVSPAAAPGVLSKLRSIAPRFVASAGTRLSLNAPGFSAGQVNPGNSAKNSFSVEALRR